ncbi:excision nuclease subunit C [Gammaproteobacteria bacterium]
MVDGGHKVLYVGKAKNLKYRLRNYFYSVKDPKTLAFMAQVKNIEIIITVNENAALLLESNLIKTLKPRYNILFKDDKSFPYLFLSQHDFPRLSVIRAATDKIPGKYFGPFPSAKAVNFTIDLLQKIFQLRVCQDGFLQSRTRPCMFHQIKLCSAPCAGFVDKEMYASQVKLVEQFLSNKSNYIVEQLTKSMDVAAARLDYEQATIYRDQIISIRKVQTQQAITKGTSNLDIIALATNESAICIDILFVRSGMLLGNKTYFPIAPKFNLSPDEILMTFLTQHYLQNEISEIVPDKILVNIKLQDRLGFSILLSEKFKRKVVISDHITGAQKHLITTAEANASNALKTHLASAASYFERLRNFKDILHLSALPRHIECFDVSHTMGEAQVAALVVFDEYGANKSAYRRYNIKTTNVGDDYGALREALSRRYGDLRDLPDVIVIDGGRGQLNIAAQVLQKLQIDNIFLMAIAKGSGRKPGLEEIYIYGRKDPLILAPQSPALHFIQQIRDESHRFAITGHRKKMVKLRRQSILGNIVGVGKSRQMTLLKHFGGLTELKGAGIDDLAKIKGISCNLARRVYEYLHAE